MVQLTAIKEATDDQLWAAYDQLCIDRMVPGANFKDLADNITQVQDELHERKLICTVEQLMGYEPDSKLYVVRDPRQRSTDCREGYFLHSYQFPAIWTPHSDGARIMSYGELVSLIKDWVYVEDCVVTQV